MTAIVPLPAADVPPQTPAQRILQITVTAVLVVGPFAGLVAAVWLLWGRGVGYADAGLALFLYLLTGFGVTVGFHRCLTHRSFTARPGLRVALALAGSMSFQGEVNGWVAVHRRHHAFTDRPGDPHSPYRYGTGAVGQLRGLLHAHAGWLFRNDPTSRQTYAPDMLADPAMLAISRAFPALCVVSLALPFGIGWAIGAPAGRCWRCCGPGWSGSSCCSTSPGASTRCATCSAAGPTPPAGTTGPRTCGRWPCCRSARAGTTRTTPIRPAHGTASTAARSTCPPGSSACSSGWAGPPPCAGRAPPGSRSTAASRSLRPL